jgi:predicted transposase YdaD
MLNVVIVVRKAVRQEGKQVGRREGREKERKEGREQTL